MAGEYIDYRVLAGWVGNFATEDSWRLGRNITRVLEQEEHWKIETESVTSYYLCHKECEGMTFNMAAPLRSLEKEAGENEKMTVDRINFEDFIQMGIVPKQKEET